MIAFLVRRPVAVIMTCLALTVLGIVACLRIPVTLLPDTPIPKIYVKVDAPGKTADEIERRVVSQLLRQLQQVEGVNDIRSTIHHGTANIVLTMDYGIDTDFAFVEANEKIDASRGLIDRDGVEIRTAKASATDIPVMFINATLNRHDATYLSAIVENIVSRRLEQLPEVSMVDMTGLTGRGITITPRHGQLEQLRLSMDDIEQALQRANTGTTTIRLSDYGREYFLTIDNALTSVDDIASVPIPAHGRIMRLGDLVEIKETATESAGISLSGNQASVTMCVIKNPGSSMDDMKEAVGGALASITAEYPELSFRTTRDQSVLLDLTVGNLEESLVIGLLLVFAVCMIFINGLRLSLAISLTMLAGVSATFLVFWICGLTINIISVAGLIIAVGMMIDNAVIVAENIVQNRTDGMSVLRSCISGTSELVTPMLSSIFTTISVFVPMVFLSGISGAIFKDEALAITIGLLTSFAVSITLLPVLISLTPLGPSCGKPTPASRIMTSCYERGIRWTFRHKKTVMAGGVALLAVLPLLYMLSEKERLPEIHTTDIALDIDWNEPLSTDEMQLRIRTITQGTDSLLVDNTAFSGPQDFILDITGDMTTAESQLYFDTRGPSALEELKKTIAARMSALYPGAVYEFSRPENLFESIFASDQAMLEANIMFYSADNISKAAGICESISRELDMDIKLPRPDRHLVLTLNRERLASYGISNETVTRTLHHALGDYTIVKVDNNDRKMPVAIARDTASVAGILASTFVEAQSRETSPQASGEKIKIPLSALVTTGTGSGFSTLSTVGSNRVFTVRVECGSDDVPEAMEKISRVMERYPEAHVTYSGSYFSDMKIRDELMVVLLVSLVMIYFILSAQFGSLTQPLVIMVEIPLDISAALLTLIITGTSVNIMSVLGIIAACGVVVNDSILKLDAINTYRASGMPLMEAIHTAGVRRLNSIVMTTLTSIISMVPVLFFSDLSAEIQKPFAIAMISALGIGTVISIFAIPLLYYLIHRHETEHKASVG